MVSIKTSFADCSTCDLLEAPSCILETNSEDDLTKVDVVFVSENPGKQEVDKGVPLIGKAGQTFRKPFDKYVKKNCKWLLTNCVLCMTINEDGTTGNPTDETIEKCKENCFRMIEQCNPKLIVLMGTSPMKAFGIAKSGITNLRGQMFKWRDRDILLTVHPSFVNRNQSFKERFEADIKMAAELLGAKFETQKLATTKTGKKGIYRYEIPKKFYTNEFRLVDIQFLNKTNNVLYIFRDKDNKKVYHKESDEYVCYTAPDDVQARKVVPYESLEQVVVPYKQKSKLDANKTYEGDMRISAKHAIDYYYFNQEEAPRTDLNIMFFDIEVDTGKDNRGFPDPKVADFPINIMSSVYHGEKICYVVDNGTEPITEKEGVELKVFKDERKMLTEFIKDFKKVDPDFLAGWHLIGFDMEYLFNRLPKLKIPVGSMSKFGEFFVDSFRFSCNLPGCVVLDQTYLYRSFTFGNKESYKLGFIAQEELGITKVETELPLNVMYYEQLNKLIEYNVRDAELLEKLESKLHHVNLLNELRLICNTSFSSGGSSFGQVDSIIISHLRNMGLASKNSDPHIEKESYPGAYVQEPVPGIYNLVTDFDFTSLYPSIVMTYNVGVNNFVLKTKDPMVGYDLSYDVENVPDKIDIIVDPLFSAQEKSVPKEKLFEKIKSNNWVHTINGCFFTSHKDEKSIYSQVLESLLSSRKDYKKLMLDAKESGDKEKKELYDTKQLVYKVLANALYGVIANKAFRFFDTSCAAAITLGGQEALKNSIIEGDSFMKHLHKRNDLERPKQITKQEMYSDEMPDRSPEYIITGDTDSIFCCFESFGKDKTNEEIKSFCDQIQDYLNTKIIGEIIKKHNVPLGDSRLELKNELIISRGIFLAKKRYAIHVTNNEGRTVDEIVYLGLEIKRSDYPSKSKEFLKELLDLILKSEKISLPKLYTFINSKEKEFIQLIKEGSKTIARPVSYGKKLKDYKVVPQGVKAMEAFNAISYHAHSVGDRAYMFRISGLDEEKAPKDILERYYKYVAENGKVSVIAVPDEEARLPNYYIPDTKGNLKFSFTDRCDLLLKPLTEVKKKMEILTI